MKKMIVILTALFAFAGFAIADDHGAADHGHKAKKVAMKKKAAAKAKAKKAEKKAEETTEEATDEAESEMDNM